MEVVDKNGYLKTVGLRGPQGTTGIQGDLGIQGIQGIDGLYAAQGIQGTTGIQGSFGVQGYKGPQGVQGIDGIQGSYGYQGVTGEQGIQGLKGVQGNYGIQGTVGPIGNTGVQGLKGEQGLIGVQGCCGPQGIQGIQGPQGIQGTQGIKGSQGAIGSQGTIGATGSIGSQGIQGIQGSTGVSPGGTVNYLAKFTGATTLGNSLLYDNGTNVGLGTNTVYTNNRFAVEGGITGTPSWDNATLELRSTGGSKVNLSFHRAGFSHANIYSEDGSLAFAEGSIEKMRLINGNLGIGTITPGSRVEISGPTGSYQSGIGFVSTGTGARTYRTYIGTNGSFYFDDATAGATRITLTATGLLGIGTTSPLQQLHVAGNIHMDGSMLRFPVGVDFLTLANVSGSWNSLQTRGINMGDWYTNPDYGDVRIGDYNFDIIRTDGSHLLTVANSGNVGIGTSSPAQKLEVAGNIYINGGNGEGFLLNGGLAIYRQNGADLAFNTNGSEKVRILANGSVGIGTTSPGQKLQIANGNVYTDQGGFIAYRTDGGTGLEVNGGDLGPGSYIAKFKNYSNADQVVINGSGDVGIGTNTPTKYMSSTETLLNITNGNVASLYLHSTAPGGHLYNMSSISSGDLFWYDVSAGTERMRLAANGNFGINTTTPGYQLDVNGWVGAARFYPYNSGGTYISGDTAGLTVSGSGYLYAAASGGSYFEGNVRIRGALSNDTAAYMQINGGTSAITFINGYLGVGTSSISARIDTNGSIASNSGLTNASSRPAVNSGTLTNGEIRGYSATSTGADDGFLRVSAGGGTNANTKSYIDLSGYSTVSDMDRNIIFGTSGTERMRLTTAGYLGINTSAPICALDVAGSIGVSGDITDTTAGKLKWRGGNTFFAGGDDITATTAIPEEGVSSVNNGITLDSWPDTRYNGTVLTQQTAGSSDLFPGQIVSLRSNNTWEPADATTSNSQFLLAMVLTQVAANAGELSVLLEGQISTSYHGQLGTSVPGVPLYISTAAGKITETAPSGTGQFVRLIGHNIYDNTDVVVIRFDPDNTWIGL